MLPKVIDTIAFTVLWVCTLLVILSLAGIVIAVVPLGWALLSLYSFVGLASAWMLYKRTVKPTKPVTHLLVIQCLFVLGVSLACFVLGQLELFGFTHHESQIAALPVIFFVLMFIRRAILVSVESQATRKSIVGIVVQTIGYLWMAGVLAYLLLTMAGVFMIDFFEGVSLMLSPMNFVSWLVVFIWLLPAFLLRALGRSMRGIKLND